MKIGLLSDTHGWLDSKILDFSKIAMRFGIAGISVI